MNKAILCFVETPIDIGKEDLFLFEAANNPRTELVGRLIVTTVDTIHGLADEGFVLCRNLIAYLVPDGQKIVLFEDKRQMRILEKREFQEIDRFDTCYNFCDIKICTCRSIVPLEQFDIQNPKLDTFFNMWPESLFISAYDGEYDDIAVYTAAHRVADVLVQIDKFFGKVQRDLFISKAGNREYMQAKRTGRLPQDVRCYRCNRYGRSDNIVHV